MTTCMDYAWATESDSVTWSPGGVLATPPKHPADQLPAVQPKVKAKRQLAVAVCALAENAFILRWVFELLYTAPVAAAVPYIAAAVVCHAWAAVARNVRPDLLYHPMRVTFVRSSRCVSGFDLSTDPILPLQMAPDTLELALAAFHSRMSIEDSTWKVLHQSEGVKLGNEDGLIELGREHLIRVVGTTDNAWPPIEAIFSGPINWMTGTAINALLSHFYCDAFYGDDPTQKMLFLPDYFLQHLQRKEEAGQGQFLQMIAASWKMFYSLAGVDRLLDASVIVSPYCTGDHWFLLVARNILELGWRVMMLNSMPTGNDGSLRLFRRYLVELSFWRSRIYRPPSGYRPPLEESSVKLILPQCFVPQQNDASSCGIMTTLAGIMIALDKPLEYSMEDIFDARSIFAAMMTLASDN